MNRREIEELFKQFDKEAEIVIIDSLGSEFPIDRIDLHDEKIAIILKRHYKNAEVEPLPLKLESNRNENK